MPAKIAAVLSNATKIFVETIKRQKHSYKRKICLDAFGSIPREIQDVILTLDMSGKFHINVPKGFLLLGPPGVGKSSLIAHLAELWNFELFVLNGADVFGADIGESERNLRKIFETVRWVCRIINCQPRLSIVSWVILSCCSIHERMTSLQQLKPKVAGMKRSC